MNEAEYTASEENFAAHLRQLRLERRERKETTRSSRRARQPLSAAERANILAKTAGRCHICGGPINELTWHADHVLAHSAGGAHSANNYLPAHALCNNYRWDYSAEEFQHILKLGVWMWTQIERRTTFGREAAARFLAYERARRARRASGTPVSISSVVAPEGPLTT
jgi:5-methylcytosine-specific restriction endonuclease McrA